MAFLLNASATVLCAHGGQVTLIPKQQKVLVGGAPAMTVTDVMSSPIVGCTVPPTPASKPCLMLISVPPVPMVTVSSKVLIGGKPALLGGGPPWTGAVTDGVPPTPLAMVPNAGQMKVQALA